jgi:hypothetical protein
MQAVILAALVVTAQRRFISGIVGWFTQLAVAAVVMELAAVLVVRRGIGGAGGSNSSQVQAVTLRHSCGSGGGGAGSPTSGGANANGGNGSDGVVIVRTADTVPTATTTGAPTVTTAGGYTNQLSRSSQ